MIRRTLLLLTLTLLTACEVVDFPTPTAAPASSNTTTPSDDSWYRLYFTNPSDKDDKDNRPEESIDDYVVASIASAARTVDAATYEFDLPSMAGALIDAHNRGLVVRLVTDTDSMEEEEVRRLIEAGVEVVDDQRSAIMHDKFVVVDGALVWTGSMNLTTSDTYRNNNNLLRIESAELAQAYLREFDEMFVDDMFGPESPRGWPALCPDKWESGPRVGGPGRSGAPRLPPRRDWTSDGCGRAR